MRKFFENLSLLLLHNIIEKFSWKNNVKYHFQNIAVGFKRGIAFSAFKFFCGRT